MTDISVTSTVTQAEKRNWLLSAHGTDPGATPSVTLDVSKFTAGTHYPNGFVQSGIVLGQVTATKLYGPYDSAAVDGRAVAAGHLFSSQTIKTGAVKVGGALVVHGFVNESKLPLTAGTGSLDAAAKTALKLIHYSV